MSDILASGMNMVGGLVVMGVAAKIGSDIVKSTGSTKTKKVISTKKSMPKKSYRKTQAKSINKMYKKRGY